MSLGWVKRTPPGFEFAVKLYQKFTHPEAGRVDQDAESAPPTSTRSRRGIEPLAAGRPARAAAGAVSRQLQGHAGSARLPRLAADDVRDYAVAVELRHRSWSDDAPSDLRSAARARRCVDADRRAEIPLLDPAGPDAEREGVLLHAAARPERRAVVGARAVGRSLQLPVFGSGAEADSPKR